MLRFEPTSGNVENGKYIVRVIRGAVPVVAWFYRRNRVRFNERVTLSAEHVRQIADRLDELNQPEG